MLYGEAQFVCNTPWWGRRGDRRSPEAPRADTTLDLGNLGKPSLASLWRSGPQTQITFIFLLGVVGSMRFLHILRRHTHIVFGLPHSWDTQRPWVSYQWAECKRSKREQQELPVSQLWRLEAQHQAQPHRGRAVPAEAVREGSAPCSPFPSGGPLACQGDFIFTQPSLWVRWCIQMSPSDEDTSQTGLGAQPTPAPMPLSLTNYTCYHPTSEADYGQRHWELGIQHMSSWGTQFSSQQMSLLYFREKWLSGSLKSASRNLVFVQHKADL